MALMPTRNPQITKTTRAVGAIADRPRAFMASAQSRRRTTPLVTNSKRLIITPAKSPPRHTRVHFILDIVSSFPIGFESGDLIERDPLSPGQRLLARHLLSSRPSHSSGSRA